MRVLFQRLARPLLPSLVFLCWRPCEAQDIPSSSSETKIQWTTASLPNIAERTEETCDLEEIIHQEAEGGFFTIGIPGESRLRSQ